jgi:hypothetical protein
MSHHPAHNLQEELEPQACLGGSGSRCAILRAVNSLCDLDPSPSLKHETRHVARALQSLLAIVLEGCFKYVELEISEHQEHFFLVRF